MESVNTGKGVGFQRIRRITGYLVGTMGNWNDAKKAEEKDRVKHIKAGDSYEGCGDDSRFSS